MLGERQVVVDCDVLQADGGTRTASICGGYLALHDALARLVQGGQLGQHPLHSLCAAISVGIVDATPVLDLPYVEDSRAEVDMNVVMLAGLDGQESRFVEVQGTAEGTAFTPERAGRAAGAGRARPRASCSTSSASTCRAARSPAGERTAGVRHQLVCSSANPDKVAEIAAIVGGVVDLLPRPPEVAEVVEDADTLEGNARLKAEALVQATGFAAVADDTGLVRRGARRCAGRLVGPLRGRARDLRGQPGQAPGRARRCAGRPRTRRPGSSPSRSCAGPTAVS